MKATITDARAAEPMSGMNRRSPLTSAPPSW